VCGTIGLIVACHPGLWLDLFQRRCRSHSSRLRSISASSGRYVCFGLGLGLFFVAQGFGRGAAAASANTVRLAANVAGGLAAIYWLDLGVIGLFAAVAAGFCLYAALLVLAVLKVKEPGTAAPPHDIPRPAGGAVEGCRGPHLSLFEGAGTP